jgi:hypothetical protein
LRGRKVIILILLFIVCAVSTFEVLNNWDSPSLQEWYIKIIVAFCLFLEYSILYKFTGIATLTRSQQSAIILVAMALPVFGYAIFGIQIPQITYPAVTQENLVSSDGIPITFYAVMNFTTKEDSFSAGNPVFAQVTVINSNVSNLLDYVSEVSFTGAFFSPMQYTGGIIPMNGYLNLTQVGNNTYYANGTLIWYQSINTHVIWLPPFNGTSPLYFDESYWQQRGMDLLNILPSSDFLTVKSNYLMTQLTYVLIGFAILTLQPIIRALFLVGTSKSEDSKKPPQGEPQDKQHSKKHQ